MCSSFSIVCCSIARLLLEIADALADLAWRPRAACRDPGTGARRSRSRGSRCRRCQTSTRQHSTCLDAGRAVVRLSSEFARGAAEIVGDVPGCPEISVGAVPRCETTARAPPVPGAASRPVSRSIATRSMPAAAARAAATARPLAFGRANRAHPQRQRGMRAVALGAELGERIVEARSTPRRARGRVNPMNHASVLSLVVPVLPAAGRPSASRRGRGAARRPPRAIMSSSWNAVRSSSSWPPSRRDARRGIARRRSRAMRSSRRAGSSHGSSGTARVEQHVVAAPDAHREPRRDRPAAPRDHRVRARELDRLHARRAERHRPHARERRRDAEPARERDHRRGADAIEHVDRGRVERRRERVLREHDAAELCVPDFGFQCVVRGLVVLGDRRVAQRGARRDRAARRARRRRPAASTPSPAGGSSAPCDRTRSGVPHARPPTSAST